MKTNKFFRYRGWLATFTLYSSGLCANEPTAADLIKLELADLVAMQVKVTSAGKNPAQAKNLPYAAHVISAEDIKSSAARNIPEALRLAPGVSVEQISGSEWSVSVRGAGGRFSRFVLVLVNGRSVFNTLFSGVNWDELNIPLLDIARIEVIRGPNGAAWGPNAVNGIINIITDTTIDKPAANRLEAWSGEFYRRGMEFSYRLTDTERLQSNVSGLYQHNDGLVSSRDNLTEAQRTDWRVRLESKALLGDNSLLVMAEALSITQNNYWPDISLSVPQLSTAANREDKQGFVLQADYSFAVNHQWQGRVKASISRLQRDTTLYQWDSEKLTFDVEMLGALDNQTFTMGVNLRQDDGALLSKAQFDVSVDPPNETLNFYGLYFGDVISFLDDELQLHFAARYDTNDHTASQFQPSARVLWQANERNRFWFGISEAASLPSRAIVDPLSQLVRYTPPQQSGLALPLIYRVNQQEGDNNTELRATELGHRYTAENFYLDMTLFHFQYDKEVLLRNNQPPMPMPLLAPQYLLWNFTSTAFGEFRSSGAEVSLRAELSPTLSTQLAVSYLDSDPKKSSTPTEDTVFFLPISGAAKLISWHSVYQPNDNWQLSGWLRYNSGNDELSVTEFTTLDMKLSYQVTPTIQLYVAAKNLIDTNHVETQREIFSADSFVVEQNVLVGVHASF